MGPTVIHLKHCNKPLIGAWEGCLNGECPSPLQGHRFWTAYIPSEYMNQEPILFRPLPEGYLNYRHAAEIWEPIFKKWAEGGLGPIL